MRYRALWFGWVLSLGLHGLVLFAAVYASRHVREPTNGSRGIDTRAPGFEVTITLVEDRPLGRPITPVLPNPAPLPKAIETAPPLQPVKPAERPIVIPAPPPIIRAQPGSVQQTGGSEAGTGASGRETGVAGNGGLGMSRLPIPAAARSVVFVLDRSASMGIEDRLSVARSQILASLRQLPAASRFQIVAYNRQSERLLPAGSSGLMPVGARTMVEASIALENLIGEGGNDHLEGLRAALDLEPDAIVLLTDADDLTMELVRKVTGWNRGRCSINAVTVGSAPRNAMETLARSNHGECRCIELK